MLLAAAIERLYELNVGTTPLEEGAPHEKPHKPLLLLAAFDLIERQAAHRLAPFMYLEYIYDEKLNMQTEYMYYERPFATVSQGPKRCA